MDTEKPKRTRKKEPVRRDQHWARLLHDFVEAERGMAFDWGSRDCCLFACDGIRATTGLDPAAKMFRGKYHDATGAARLLKKHGGVEAVAAKVCARHGFTEVRVGMAQRGDVVLADMEAPGQPGRAALGLCAGGEAVFRAADGLVFVPMAQCRRAWAVARPVADNSRVP